MYMWIVQVDIHETHCCSACLDKHPDHASFVGKQLLETIGNVLDIFTFVIKLVAFV